MTPDQFFDELDKLFGYTCDAGYVNHLKRIKLEIGIKEEMEESWLSEEDVSAQVDPLYEEIKTVKMKAMKQVRKLNKQNKEFKDGEMHQILLKEQEVTKRINLEREIKELKSKLKEQ